MDSIAVNKFEQAHPEHDEPFLRWWIDPTWVSSAWKYGDAIALAVHRDRKGEPATKPHIVALGDADELAAPLAMAARELGTTPERLTIPLHSRAASPADWTFDRTYTWDAMWTDNAPAPQPGEHDVEALESAAEINALLDQATPDSYGRPGEPDIRHWAGVRDSDGSLLGVGALTIRPGTGVAHLRGISTLPSARGHGLASAVSAALTRIGLETISPVVTLGAYSDNAAAIAVYRRLGFRHLHTLLSGPLRP